MRAAGRSGSRSADPNAATASDRSDLRKTQHEQAASTSRKSRTGRTVGQSRKRKEKKPVRGKRTSVRRAARKNDVAETVESTETVTVAPDDVENAQGEPGVTADAVQDESEELVSTSVGEIRRKSRSEELQATSRKYLRRFIAVIGLVVVLLGAWAVLYNSTVFSIETVNVKGVEHLTGEEMTALANVPADTTLLRVDSESIINRVKQSSWVKDVQVNRVFPNTLEISVTERPVAAIAEIPADSGSSVKLWAIADDRIWLMPIPEAGSEAAATTSSKVYEDVENVRHITNLPFGTKAEIGKTCSDDVVNNVLSILEGMTTDLSGQVTKVSAASVAETTLYLDNGVEIAFGAAESIRDKERVIQKILEENPDGVAYINVRMVENPTWRAI